MTVTPRTGSRIEELLARSGRFFIPGEISADLRTVTRRGGRDGDVFYRDRWSHDKVVRSTHGVNCTGSCSWKIYVKDDIITWETQETDYPSVGPDRPEYEPRGCPRGAAFFLVHVFADAGAPSVRPRRACRDVSGGEGTFWVIRWRPGPTSRPTRGGAAATSAPAARAGWSGSAGPRPPR